MKKKKILKKIVMVGAFSLVMLRSTLAFAEGEADPTSKINTGLQAIQGVLTGIIATVAIIAALKITIAKLPSVDDPHVKNELVRGLCTVGLVGAVGCAITWLGPWVFKLFA